MRKLDTVHRQSKPRKFEFWQLSGWRRFSWWWWKDVLNPINYWIALRIFWQRGRRGWSDHDLISLDMYLAEWMPDALRHLQARNMDLNFDKLKGRRKFQRMIIGWEAAWHCSEACDCMLSFSGYGSDHPQDDSWTDRYKKYHQEYWWRRWEDGSRLFRHHFFRLWL